MIEWKNGTRTLGELVAWERNPRKIKQKNAELLIESAEEFGQPETLAIGPDNELYDGHQRLQTWIAEYGPDYKVDVRIASRPLTEKERKKLAIILHKGAAGEWDFDVMADEFEIDDLLDWGFEPYELGLTEGDIDGEAHWGGMPEFENEEDEPHQSIKVHFASAQDVAKFAQLLGQTVTDKTKYIWFPHRPDENMKQYRVRAGDES